MIRFAKQSAFSKKILFLISVLFTLQMPITQLQAGGADESQSMIPKVAFFIGYVTRPVGNVMQRACNELDKAPNIVAIIADSRLVSWLWQDVLQLPDGQSEACEETRHDNVLSATTSPTVLKQPANMSQAFVYGLLCFAVCTTLVPSTQAFTVCHNRPKSTELCIEMPQEKFTLRATDQCYRQVVTTLPEPGKSETEKFLPLGISMPVLGPITFSFSAHGGKSITQMETPLSGKVSYEYEQQEDGSFKKQLSVQDQAKEKVYSFSWGSLWNAGMQLIGIASPEAPSTHITEEMIQYGTSVMPEKPCLLHLSEFPGNSTIIQATKELSNRLGMKSVNTLDFSHQTQLCEWIQNNPTKLLKLNDNHLSGLIAQSLAYTLLHTRKIDIDWNSVPQAKLSSQDLIHPEYKNNGALFVFSVIVSEHLLTNFREEPIKPPATGPSWWSSYRAYEPSDFRSCKHLEYNKKTNAMEFTLDKDGVQAFIAMNFHRLADIIAGLATLKPSELAHAYAILAQKDSNALPLRILPNQEVSDLILPLKNGGNNNPLELKLFPLGEIVAGLLSLQENIDKIQNAFTEALKDLEPVIAD